ncbi:MAG: lysine--tRNA ligase [Fimbriimonadales bacterium]|nr:lysine--tRNA ligase [Fimbriimonadales bacterium]
MSEESSIRAVRLQKLEEMRRLGADPYAVERFETTHDARTLLERFEELEGQPVRFAGRIVSYRLMGKAGFAHLSDGEAKIQGYFRRDDLGERWFEVFKLLDIGDHVGVAGELFLTKTGERSIHVRELTPLSKSLQVLPLGKEKDGERWYGLQDTELRYRHRHLDLICNPEARRMLLDRMRIVSAVRRFLDSKGFLEVETPVLQLEAGGAAATPFKTFYNAYDLEVKLRISLELYLKRVICGDVPKVYEIGRVFRNEGVSNRHNPEFTLLEFYQAYANLEDMMDLVEELFRSVCQDVFGTPVVDVKTADGSVHQIDFSRRWRRVDLLEEIERHAGVRPEEFATLEKAKAAMERCGLPTENEHHVGGIIEKLLERFVEPTLIDPTFVVGYPLETSPLAKKDPNKPGFTRRFEGYVRGREVCNAFSEINDPIDQRERFEQQLGQRMGGADETHPYDEEFLFALEGGMPPTGGCGIGMDRLAMVLTGADVLREVILFPMMRPEAPPDRD